MNKNITNKINSVNNRYRAFALEYVHNNFNGSMAYQKVYKVSAEVAKVNACKLLTSTNFIKVYSEVLKEIGFDISGEWVLNEIVNLFKTGKKEATKSRMLELLSKIKDLYKESTQSVAIFSGLEAQEQAIVKSRLT